MLYAWLYVVYSSYYSFRNNVSAKLLSTGYILLNWVKLGFVKYFLNGELEERVDVSFERRKVRKQKYYFSYKLCHSLRFIISCLLF